MVGGQVGIVGHIELADQTKIGAQSGISKSIKETGKSYMGSPATPLRDHFKSQAIFIKLPEMLKRIEELEEKIINLSTLEEDR